MGRTGIGIAEVNLGVVRSLAEARRTKGRRLVSGGTIAVPSPASPVFDDEALASAVDWLEAEGYRVVFTANANQGRSYAAGSPAARARDIEAAFAEPEIDAILCIGGGHASAQLLRHLDFELIADNPKPFVGFSDITVLHTAIRRETGLVTLWGPMLGQLGGADRFTQQSLLRALTSDRPLGVVAPDSPGETITPGVVEGELVGGTTSLLCALMGTPWEIDTRDKILLLEDEGVEPCRVDRYMTQLLNAGKLDDCAGIVLAEHTDCAPHPDRPIFHGPQPLVRDLLRRLVKPLGIPAVYGLPLGHGTQMATVPLGARARLDATAGRLEVLEEALV